MFFYALLILLFIFVSISNGWLYVVDTVLTVIEYRSELQISLPAISACF